MWLWWPTKWHYLWPSWTACQTIWSTFKPDFNWLVTHMSCLDAYTSRSDDFCGDNRQTDGQTDYFIPAHARGVNISHYTDCNHSRLIIICYKMLLLSTHQLLLHLHHAVWLCDSGRYSQHHGSQQQDKEAQNRGCSGNIGHTWRALHTSAPVWSEKILLEM